MQKKISIKITQNIYGNYRVKISGQDVKNIGSFKFDAVAEVADFLNDHPEGIISPLSEVTMKDVEEFRAALARIVRI